MTNTERQIEENSELLGSYLDRMDNALKQTSKIDELHANIVGALGVLRYSDFGPGTKEAAEMLSKLDVAVSRLRESTWELALAIDKANTLAFRIRNQNN